MKHYLLTCLLFLSLPFVYGQTDSTIIKLAQFAYNVENFGQLIPQEKVYLHFDNTSYFHGDYIWFQCYLVTAEANCPSTMSKTVYVELLNPGGNIVAKQILPVKNGRCHGEFQLNHLPFYSGFYEIRAYTKYMLNFGKDQIFSRVFPVFDRPKKRGDYADKKLMKFSSYRFPQKRKKTKKQDDVNIKFYPEGGNLVQGVTSRVAFEVTNSEGEPVDLSGMVVDAEKKEIVPFSTVHDGKGVFSYTPLEENKDKAVVQYDGKEFKFDLPEPEQQGYVMTVDNMSNQDSLEITVQKNRRTMPRVLGLVFQNAGKLYSYATLKLFHNRPIHVKVDKSELPSGVNRIVLFDEIGQVVADRLSFIQHTAPVQISVTKNKAQYEAFDKIDMDFMVRDTAGKPVNAPLSISVRDAWSEVDDGGRSILTDLLLMSEVKGYIHRPGYYFESQDRVHQQALDLLMMVQGWRRYNWNYWAGLDPFDLKYLPERGIEVHGNILAFVRNKPRSDVEISAFLTQRGRIAEYEKYNNEEEEEEEDEESLADDTMMNLFKSDSLGHFSFVTDVKGKWSMVLSVAKKGKRKDYRILLDRLFSPEPEKYQLGDLNLHLVEDSLSKLDQSGGSFNLYDFDELVDSYEDSLRKQGIHEKVQRLDEVVVKAKKKTYEQEVYEAKAASSVYYDVQAEIEEIKDRGGYLGDDIIELLVRLDPNFTRYRVDAEEFVKYKGSSPLFVIDYQKPVPHDTLEYFKYKNLHLSAIRSIYINDDNRYLREYADPIISSMDLDTMFYGVVFIETWPESMISVNPKRGVRKTWLEGYSEVKEFYHKDYSKLPKSDDYRRTLYWNPEVVPDSTGKASIHFYNNSRCKNIRISAETVTSKGEIGVLKE